MAGEAPSGGGGKIVAGINVTPLVDVVLVLLIILMVTGSFMGRKMFEAELPKASAGENIKDTPLIVEVRRDASIWVAGEQFDLDGLKVRAARPDGPDGKPAQNAIIAADTNVRYGIVVGVIDTLRVAGVPNFGLEIKPETLSE